MRSYKYYDLITALFVTILVVSNIASSAKIIDTGVTFFNQSLIFDAGTILFPISYIFGDILTEVYGYRNSRRVIWIGFFCMLITSLIFLLISRLPGERNWEINVGQESFNAVLGGISSGALLIASLSAYWGGEFTNSFVLAKLKVITQGRFLWIRTVASTLVGQGVDTFVFVTMATVFKVPGFVPEIWFPLIFTNYLFKCTVEALMTPITYRVVNFLKNAEGEDFFDANTNFNPFLIH